MEESQYIRDIAEIMAKGTGPFTRKMLAEELSKMYPHLRPKEIKLLVSGAIQDDRYINNRFKIVKQSWWDLKDRG